MRPTLTAILSITAFQLAACDTPAPAAPVSAPPTETHEPATPEPFATGHALSAEGTPAPETLAASCGELNCRRYSSVVEAFQPLLESDVQVIAFGEAHAQQGTESIPSTARRFTEEILPIVAGRSTDLVLELMLPNPNCKEREEKVVERQKEVTRPQAETNQHEYVALAQRAKDLGIRPHVLRPSCKQYERILAAGGQDIGLMLTMIADLTARKVKALLGRQALQGTRGIILTYGGLMHNDLVPKEGREKWTFGPTLRESTKEKYAAVDLIVREYIKETEVWKALPWVPHFEKARFPKEALAYEPAPNDYVFVYPETQQKDVSADTTKPRSKGK